MKERGRHPLLSAARGDDLVDIAEQQAVSATSGEGIAAGSHNNVKRFDALLRRFTLFFTFSSIPLFSACYYVLPLLLLSPAMPLSSR